MQTQNILIYFLQYKNYAQTKLNTKQKMPNESFKSETILSRFVQFISLVCNIWLVLFLQTYFVIGKSKSLFLQQMITKKMSLTFEKF